MIQAKDPKLSVYCACYVHAMCVLCGYCVRAMCVLCACYARLICVQRAQHSLMTGISGMLHFLNGTLVAQPVEPALMAGADDDVDVQAELDDFFDGMSASEESAGNCFAYCLCESQCSYNMARASLRHRSLLNTMAASVFFQIVQSVTHSLY